MDDFEKIKRAMASLRDTEAWPYLKEFIENEKHRSLNTAKTDSSDNTLRSMGAYSAYEKVLNFVVNN